MAVHYLTGEHRRSYVQAAIQSQVACATQRESEIRAEALLRLVRLLRMESPQLHSSPSPSLVLHTHLSVSPSVCLSAAPQRLRTAPGALRQRPRAL